MSTMHHVIPHVQRCGRSDVAIAFATAEEYFSGKLRYLLIQEAECFVMYHYVTLGVLGRIIHTDSLHLLVHLEQEQQGGDEQELILAHYGDENELVHLEQQGGDDQ